MADKGLIRTAVPLLLLLLARPCLAEDWFGSPIVTTTPYNLEMVRAADMDNDGVSDAVVQVVGLDSLVVYRGDREGRMTRWASASDFGNPGTHQDYAPFDYWQDGHVDLVHNNAIPGSGQLDIDIYWNGQYSNVV